MSIYQYTANPAQSGGDERNEQWHGTPAPLEELPAGLIEDEV